MTKTPDDGQKGAQAHPEGTHGDKTHQRLIETLHEGREESTDAEEEERPGRHKIFEDREQHDEADKNSEKNRLRRERDD